MLAKHKHTRHAVKALDTASQVYGDVQTMNSRDLEDNEDLFVRDFDAVDDLEAREPAGNYMKAVGSVFILYNKYPLNADIWLIAMHLNLERCSLNTNIPDML